MKSNKELPRGHVYIKSEHTSWGDSIRVTSSTKRVREIKRIHGHLQRIPEVGDILQIDAEHLTVEYQFTNVDACSNPSDMFFADVELIGGFDTKTNEKYSV